MWRITGGKGEGMVDSVVGFDRARDVLLLLLLLVWRE